MADGVEIVTADIMRSEDIRRAYQDAAVVYRAAHAPYSEWQEVLPAIADNVIAGASVADAVLVVVEPLHVWPAEWHECLIASVHGALRGAGAPLPEPDPKLVPHIPIKKSVTPDYIFSLEDGKPYKSLKRHLAKHGLTPDAYRAKWGLPRDYPMVAANYAERRSELARNLGLGGKGAAKKAAGKAGKRKASS
jgi:predicted transcriptional regulator